VVEPIGVSSGVAAAAERFDLSIVIAELPTKTSRRSI
jgi:hypothetical protein